MPAEEIVTAPDSASADVVFRFQPLQGAYGRASLLLPTLEDPEEPCEPWEPEEPWEPCEPWLPDELEELDELCELLLEELEELRELDCDCGVEQAASRAASKVPRMTPAHLMTRPSPARSGTAR